MPIIENESEAGQSLDADEILASLDQPTEGGLNDAPSEGSLSAKTPAEAPTPEPIKYPEVEFTWNNQKIKAPWEKAVNWAQQGYNYSQKINALKAQQTDFEKKQQEFQTKYGVYSQIDDHANKNPDWWKFVETQWNSRGQPTGNVPPAQTPTAVPDWLIEKLNRADKFISQAETDRQAKDTEAADQALDQSIQTIRKEYSNLDWSMVDENGLTLEQQVLKHASEHGIPTFKAAFRDYQFDSLVNLEREKGKEAVGQDIQKRTKLGLLGTTSTPTKGISKAQNIRNKSYSDLATEGLEELRAGKL